MATFTSERPEVKSKARKARPKPARTLELLVRPSDDYEGWGAVRLTVGKTTGIYLFREIPADFGESAWEVEKLNEQLESEETYHVLLGTARESSCDCRGCTQHQHCKHLDGLKKLDEMGLLPRHLHRQKHTVCPACQKTSDSGQLCQPCETEANDYFDAVDAMNAMESAGMETFPSLTADEI